MAGKKPVVLELGGNAACIVDEDADLDDAVERDSSSVRSISPDKAVSASSESLSHDSRLRPD